MHKDKGAKKNGDLCEDSSSGEEAKCNKDSAQQMSKDNVMSKPEGQYRDKRALVYHRFENINILNEYNSFPEQKYSKEYANAIYPFRMMRFAPMVNSL